MKWKIILHQKLLLMQQRLTSEPVAGIKDLSDVSVSIWVSFAEIYNENIYDLLQPLPKNRIRPILKLGHSTEQVYIKDISSVCVHDELEAYQVHQYGLQNLKVCSYSSQFTFYFSYKASSDFKYELSHFCNLAGYQRSKRTLNIGVKESKNINKEKMKKYFV